MAVELAVAAPVLLLIMVIVIDMFVFAEECARFDHIVPQQVLAHVASAPMNGYSLDSRCERVLMALEDEFAKNGSNVTVAWSDAGQVFASMVEIRCEFVFAPWPLSIAGGPGLLRHECSIAVDPYTPGELL